MLLAIPLLFIPVVIYAIIIGFGVLGSGGVAAAEVALGDPLFSIPMVSGTAWNVGTGDLILFLSLILLFFELLKSTSSQKVAIVNHALSLILFRLLPGRLPPVQGVRDLDLLPDPDHGHAGRSGRLHRHHHLGPQGPGLRRRYLTGLRKRRRRSAPRR